LKDSIVAIAPFQLLVISGSIREKSFSTIICTAIRHALSDRAAINVADLGELPHYDQDLDGALAPSSVGRFKAQVTAADGIVIVSPEYNHGIPGVLKNALDWASRPAFASPFRNKPVLIVTSSVASTGGVRAQHQIRETLVAMLARPVATPEIAIASVQTKVTDGTFDDGATMDLLAPAFDALFGDIAARC
jgi:chromate reductase